MQMFLDPSGKFTLRVCLFVNMCVCVCVCVCVSVCVSHTGPGRAQKGINTLPKLGNPQWGNVQTRVTIPAVSLVGLWGTLMQKLGGQKGMLNFRQTNGLDI